MLPCGVIRRDMRHIDDNVHSVICKILYHLLSIFPVVICESGQHFIRVIFNGAEATNTPLIARMAVEKGIEASIAYASTKSIGGKAYGSMLLGVTGDTTVVNTAIEFLTDTPDVLAEEVTVNV